jgi:hypothetical protein
MYWHIDSAIKKPHYSTSLANTINLRFRINNSLFQKKRIICIYI